MKQPPPPPSKLFIRSEVLAVIEYLSVVENPPKQDKIKQIKRLSGLPAREAVLEILVKELQRATKSRELQTISELLMEIGTIAQLQEPLWRVIRTPSLSDEVKDAANLILHHLGDESDPDLYLEYLEDPQGLINRETERMLEVAASNPEALIDFIDFIFSLPVEEQCNLLNSLQADYQPDYLVNLYAPTLWADPPPEVLDQILKNLGHTRTQRAVTLLEAMLAYYQEDEDRVKIIRRAQNELKLAGLYKPEVLAEAEATEKEPHPIAQSTTLHACYATLPDGIGNQGLIVSRKKENGDILMMSAAINDVHGIIDCFGFYQLGESDFNRIVEKFHEEASKIQVPASYCLQRLTASETLNKLSRFRIPYEYTCWKVLLDDVPDTPEEDWVALCQQWANPAWRPECGNLYQHPDFSTWFVERGDHPALNQLLDDVQTAVEDAVITTQSPKSFLSTMETYGEALVQALMETTWRDFLIHRLANAAYLLHCQKTQTFASLAATEVHKLITHEPTDPAALSTGFMRQYGRRCIEEELLRLKQQPQAPDHLMVLVDSVLKAWEV
jgi:hypothetical protein